jgi:hypothetical protein
MKKRRRRPLSISSLVYSSRRALHFSGCVHSIYLHRTHLYIDTQGCERATGCREHTSLSCRRRALVRPQPAGSTLSVCVRERAPRNPTEDANNYSYLDFFSQRDSLWNSGLARALRGWKLDLRLAFARTRLFFSLHRR